MQESTWIKSKKIKNIILKILYSLISGATVFFITIYYATLIDSYIQDNSSFLLFAGMAVVFAILFISLMIHVIIHEIGHLIFGILTGYSFISFRIGSNVIVKEEEKYKLKKHNLPGTAGQCLMLPPDMENGKYPFVLYNYGGVILNLIVTIISIIVKMNVDFPLNIIFSAFSLAGFFVVLSNGIPLKIGGVPNDAYNILSMLKDEEAKKSFHLQLKTHALHSQGVRIKDLPLDHFILKEDVDLSNPLNTAIKLIEYNWYLDNLDMENAKKTLDSLKPFMSKIASLYKYEINCERIFLELIGNCDKKLIDSLYDKNLKKYVKASKFMVSKKRLLMAYEAFYNENKDLAIKHYDELKDLANNYPIKGEADMELMLANWIRERL